MTTTAIDRPRFTTSPTELSLRLGALKVGITTVMSKLSANVAEKHLAPALHPQSSKSNPYIQHLRSHDEERRERMQGRTAKKKPAPSKAKPLAKPVPKPARAPLAWVPRKITVAEACAGISATSQALIALDIPYRHVWVSENDPKCVETLHANYGAENLGRLYGDFTALDAHRDLVTADLFVCGFPCQSFSSLNQSQDVGMSASNLIAAIMLQMVTYIHNKSPRCFILENVTGFKKHKKGIHYGDFLKNLQDNDRYVVNDVVLDSFDFGVPQSRNRLYIVGILRKDLRRGHTGWTQPEPTTPKGRRVDISAVLDRDQPMRTEDMTDMNWQALMRLTLKFPDLWEQPYVASLDQSPEWSSAHNGYSPILSRSHSDALYLTNEHRFLNPNEVYRLQGFPDSFKKHRLKGALKNQIGNSMTVSVIAEIIKSIRAVSVVFG